MAQRRRTGYDDKSTLQLRSELLNIAERATTSQREIRALVRIVAEIAERLERLETASAEETAPEEQPSETDAEAAVLAAMGAARATDAAPGGD